MKLLYLSTWDFSNEESDGVCKKIKNQIRVFKDRGYVVDFIFIKNSKVICIEDGIEKEIASVGTIKKTVAYMKMYPYIKAKKYDWVYNRYGMMDTFYYRVLKRLKKNGVEIVIEIPTYPYAKERRAGIMYHLMFLWDQYYRKNLKKLVNRFVTYSKDEIIFGVPTIPIINGIDVSLIQTITGRAEQDDIINLITVAIMQKYHGYDRLLLGLRDYYNKGGKRSIVCHFVGDGPERETYEAIVDKYNLQAHVIFYGMKRAEELDEIYNTCDIGVTSMGFHRNEIYLSSELKSREYLAKGLPIVSGGKIDIFTDNAQWFYLENPADDSNIDIDLIIDFYDEIYKKHNREEVINTIREFAEKTVDMGSSMRALTDYMKFFEQDSHMKKD